MNGRILGPGGVPVIGGASQPVSPCLDLKQTEDGPTFRLPVVAVGHIQPEIIALLAEMIAPLVVKAVLEVASKASGNEDPTPA